MNYPKPTKLKVLEGNPGRRPLNTREPEPPPGIPRPPKWLKGEGRKLWKFVIGNLAHTGVVTQLDAPALAMLCREWQRYVDDDGEISPVRIGHIRGLMSTFGMTPSDRTRLVMPFLKNDDANDEERYFGT